MKYFDYEWDLEPNRILLDSELNIDKLGWQSGDYFQVKNVNGRVMLVKVDPLEKFLRDGVTAVINEEDDTVRFLNHDQHQQEVFQILGKKDE
jgi:hypothetical protein